MGQVASPQGSEVVKSTAGNHPTEEQRPRFIEKFRHRDWIDLAPTVIGPVLLPIVAALPALSPTGNWHWIESSAGKAVIIVAAVWVVAAIYLWWKKPGVAKLYQEIAAKDRRIAELEAEVDRQVSGVRGVFRLQLQRLSEELQLTGTERISLYTLDRKVFVLQGRYSAHPRYDAHGRPFYPTNEGCIGKAYDGGWYFTNDIPDFKNDEDEYYRRLEADFNIRRDVAEGFIMKSRSLAAYRIDNQQTQPMAVIVFESTSTSALEQERIKKMMGQQAHHLREFLESMRPFQPQPTYATQEGF